MTVKADQRVPVLILKLGQYPLHSGGLAAVRTLGRLGIPVYAITEDRVTPAAGSRYCAARFVWRATGQEDPTVLAAQPSEVGQRLGTRSVIVSTDDEAAVLVAEQAAELSEYFLFPPIDPGLPRALASKQKLYEMCRRHGIPAPVTSSPATGSDLAAFAQNATFPVVVKNPFLAMRPRLSKPLAKALTAFRRDPRTDHAFWVRDQVHSPPCEYGRGRKGRVTRAERRNREVMSACGRRDRPAEGKVLFWCRYQLSIRMN